jgi:hypothetical protein
LTAFGSAAQRNLLEFAIKKQLKLTVFCSREAKHFGLGAQRKSWNLPTKATQVDSILFSRAAKIF